jgi:hypothetical protein
MNGEQRQMVEGIRGLDTSTPAGRDTWAAVDNFYAQGTPYGKPFTPRLRPSVACAEVLRDARSD